MSEAGGHPAVSSINSGNTKLTCIVTYNLIVEPSRDEIYVNPIAKYGRNFQSSNRLQTWMQNT